MRGLVASLARSAAMGFIVFVDAGGTKTAGRLDGWRLSAFTRSGSTT